MKIEIEKKELIELLKFNTNVLGSNSLNPILDNILISANKDTNEIELISSNDNISSKIFSTNVNVDESGTILIKGKLFYSMISKIHNEIIVLEKIDSKYLRISNSKFAANINLVEETLYPTINFNTVESDLICNLNTSDLKQVSKKIAHSVLINNDKNSILAGINIDSTTIDGMINFIATDSYKVSILSKPFNGPKINTTILPEIMRIVTEFSQENEDIKFRIKNNNDILIEWKNCVILSRTISGNFPIIYNHFNIDAKTCFKIESTSLDSVLDHGLSLVINEKNPSCLIKVLENKLEIIFKSIEFGSSYETVDIQEYQGQNLTFMINAKYLISVLKAFGDTTLVFEFTENNKPIIIRDTKDKEFKQLILPMRYN